MLTRPLRHAVVCLFLGTGLAGSAPPVTTFYQHIAPIVYRHCSTCHRTGGAGPFPLLTYEEVKRHATQIAEVTKKRYMPPWLPEAGFGDFIEERRLTNSEIDLIADWVKHGSPAGSIAQAPPIPTFTSEWQLGKPDLVLHVTRPYQLPAGGAEVFWNFIIPVPIGMEKWVKAIEIRPGNPRVVHHASIILDRARSARKNARVSDTGFAGMDLTLAETTFDPDSNFLAWKPGSAPVIEPDGMAWRANPGMDLILNVHLRPTGKSELVNPSIGLYFTDKPRTKYAMLIELEHDGAIDIPPGDRDYTVTDDFRTPLDLTVLAVYPHAHYLGKLLEGFATLPDGTRQPLIRIPDWDLSWQGVYHFRQPVFLPAGTTISMRYHYDNSTENVRNPSHPPKRVRGGSQANDEMANLWLQVLPAGDHDQRAVLQDALMHRLFEKYPQDFSANFNLGDLLLTKGDAAAAVPYFERAAKAEPQSALAASELGVALASAARMPEAKQQFQRALQLDPKFTDARYDLASAEATGAEWDAAVKDLRQVLAERPGDPKTIQYLGEVLFAWGDELATAAHHELALQRYREALVYRPDDADLHANLGIELARIGRRSEARQELQTALRINPNAEAVKKALTALQ